MTTTWLCCLHHQEYGPLTEEQLREMAEQGQLTPQTLLRPAQSADGWAPLAQHPLPAVLAALPAGNGNGTPVESAPGAPAAPVQSAPVQSAPAPVQPAPVQTVPVQPAPVQTAPVQTVPVQPAPVQTAPVQPAPVQTAPVQTAPVQTAPVQTVPVQPAPVQPAPVQTVPVQAAPGGPVVTPAAPAMQGQLPMGTAVAPAAPSAPAGESSASDDPRLRFVRRKKSPLPMIIGLSVAGLAGVIVLMVALMGGDDDPPADDARAEAAEPAAAADGAAKGDPADTDPGADPAGGDPDAAPSATLEHRASEVSVWSPVGVRQTLRGVAAVQLESVWLADGPDGKRLKAKVNLSYLSDTPVNYSTWQGTGPVGNAAAALLLLPKSATSAERVHPAAPQAGGESTRKLTSGTQLSEVFSFPAPAEGDEMAKLMLPKEAIGKSTPPFGFDVPRSAWITGIAPDGASEPPGAIDPAPAPGPDKVAKTPPPTEPAAEPKPEMEKPEPKKNDRPPSITDIIRQAKEREREAEKKKKMEDEKKE